MAALARFGSEAPTLMALGAAVDLGELLTILRPFTPAAGLARLVTSRAVPLRLRKVVDVDVLGAGARDDLLPVDGFHVAEVVVVEQAATPGQDIYTDEGKWEITNYGHDATTVYRPKGPTSLIMS